MDEVDFDSTYSDDIPMMPRGAFMAGSHKPYQWIRISTSKFERIFRNSDYLNHITRYVSMISRKVLQNIIVIKCRRRFLQ